MPPRPDLSTASNSPNAPKPSGRFLAVDAEGFLVNEAKLENVLPLWKPAVERVVASYVEELGQNLTAVYLRGSVPRGRSLEGISGIDTFGLRRSISGTPIRWQQAAWSRELQTAITAEFPFVASVETFLSGYRPRHLDPQVAMLIATQSVCVYGEDVAPKIRRYKPGHEMVLHARHLAAELSRLQIEIQPDDRGPQVAAWCQRMMKLMIRTGFELVMEWEGAYTDDLYLCQKTMCKYYPGKRVQMRHALAWCFAPTQEGGELLSFCDWLGEWLLGKVEEVLGAMG